MALTKANMVKMLFEEIGFNKVEAKEMVEKFFEVIKLGLENGHQMKLSGFGNFLTRSKAERPGRNPKTGEETPILARRVVTFRPGLKLKNRVETYSGSEQ
jgi:integration host factor subunit alpha